MADKKKYIWCTYRDWSFKILEAIQDIPDWETGLIVTTQDCIYNFERFENREIPIIKIKPEKAKVEFQKGGIVYDKIMNICPETIITSGWSWYIPKEILEYRPCVTYHPGKLPKDRGGSPIQNQMRNGEKWTYVNVMKQEEGLDEGGIYLRKKISLDGYADDVWKRMTSAGVLLTKEYLLGLSSGNLKPKAQSDETPTICKRVRAEDAELNPANQSALQMYNIIRAHHETDPNSYVVPAYILFSHNRRLEIYEASLENTLNKAVVDITFNEDYGDEIHQIVNRTNNSDILLALTDYNNNHLYLSQVNIRLAR